MQTPEGLESDVRFWEKIFTQYKKSQCVFHDKDDLSLIYGLANIPEGSSGYQGRVVHKYVETINAALRRLSMGQSPDSKLEQLIYKAAGANRREPAFYRNLVDNVRCQRGVPLDDSISRSLSHVSMVKRVLDDHRLPMDLAYLPHLESGYHLQARSKAGARGLWQLMPATARLQGLRVTSGYDARINARMATLAAAGYLSELYQRTGAWPLAVTAYNYGINGMVRAIKKLGADYMIIRRMHKTRIFGFAARNYYPSFLAVRNVAGQLDGSRSMIGRDLSTNPLVDDEVADAAPVAVKNKSSKARL